MNARPALPPRTPIARLVAATVAAVIAAGIFVSVAELFECECKPMEKVVLGKFESPMTERFVVTQRVQ